MAQHAKSATAATVVEEAAHEVPAAQLPAASIASLADGAPDSWHPGAVVDSMGPVPLSLLAFNSAIHTVDKNSMRNNVMARLVSPYLLYVLLPVCVVALIFTIWCMMGDRKSTSESEGHPAKGGQALAQKGNSRPAGSAPGTADSLASTSSGTHALPSMVFSPISPSTRQPVQQRPKMPACILFPTMAADVRMRNRSFDVFWGNLDSAWFRVDIKSGGAEHDRLELSEVHSGMPTLCATVNLATGESGVEGHSLWLVSNSQLRANTRGLAYRDEENKKVRNAVASWQSTVHGVDTGDGRLKVGDWYLPMKVDGYQTIVHADSRDASIVQAAGLQILRADGMPFATFKPVTGGQYTVERNGAPLCYVTIGTSSYLMEAKLPNGKRVATVAKEQVRVPSGEMMLELVVEPQMDPVVILVGSIAVLRQLPAHQE